MEAHGTGTKVGDPIELNAIGTFIARHKKENDPPTPVGSIKSHIFTNVAGLSLCLLWPFLFDFF